MLQPRGLSRELDVGLFRGRPAAAADGDPLGTELVGDAARDRNVANPQSRIERALLDRQGLDLRSRVGRQFAPHRLRARRRRNGDFPLTVLLTELAERPFEPVVTGCAAGQP
jgi:hypothetical protein